MKTTLKKVLFGLICLLFIMPNYSYAHAMFLTLEKPGVFKVEYDGGGFSPRTEVVIYDENGNELGKGPVDAEGKFHFDKDLDVYSAVADDGMGHRAEYKKDVEQKTIPKLPVIIGVFAVVAVVFVIFNKKAAKQ